MRPKRCVCAGAPERGRGACRRRPKGFEAARARDGACAPRKGALLNTRTSLSPHAQGAQSGYTDEFLMMSYK